MKKISLIIVSVLTGTLVFAQHGAKFGLKGGLNVSSLKLEDNSDVDARLGLHLGAIAHIHLAPEWALQPEVVYSQEGGKATEFVTTKLDYINIPIMIQYMFNNGFRLEAGPQFGFAINQKDEVDDTDFEDDADHLYKSTNISLGFGVNYLTYSGFGVGGRYNLGISNIAEDGGQDVKTRTFQISVFYMFDSKHKAKSR